MDGLEQQRRVIDGIDREILALIEKRLHAARRIGKAKKRLGMQVFDSIRENEVIEGLKLRTSLDDSFVEDLFTRIITYCRNEQR